MSTAGPNKPEIIFPRCRARIDSNTWEAIVAACDGASLEAMMRCLQGTCGNGVPLYLPDLARLELALYTVRQNADSLPETVATVELNPTIQVLELSWTGLTPAIDGPLSSSPPVPKAERVLVWFDPRNKVVRANSASDEALLVLKMVAENISPGQIAEAGGVPIGAIDAAVDRAVGSGLLLAPPSRIRRDPAVFPEGVSPARLLVAHSFTLQWHITQACDLHCKHCYDRSDRSPMTYQEAIRVLDDLRTFCRERSVQGAVSFTGGNPLLHSRFTDIYRAAAERNFATAILGNPAPRERIEEIIGIAMPAFFQVSLEGLQDHNDSIRGPGHFKRIMAFLDTLRELKVPSMVMLTLTRENRDQVIPLAEQLRQRTDIFHFNRLALFGEGAALATIDRAGYRQFLEGYLTASESNPVMGYKDNLINILLQEQGADLFGGCSGYGCGAAFNFVTLLSDGEVHACRKLPSRLGNIREHSLAEIYDSDLAKQYRRGPSSCTGCSIRTACGGCLASAKSFGLDIFRDRDPFCFLQRM
jgi:selenobiotic family peptide radical SAM maturase